MEKLTLSEKKKIMKSVFPVSDDINADRRLVKNVSDFISENFAKIDGFDFRWTSLITSNPLLFEDIDYLKVKSFVSSTVTKQEIEAYKSGKLREIYDTFESLLVCNLQYYDRIMSYCTMIFMKYVRIGEEVVSNDLDKIVMKLEMTPTQIWCAALTSTTSTQWEIEYAWGRGLTTKPIDESDKSILETSWQRIYRNNHNFGKFMEYSALRCNSTGFRQTFIKDKTSNRKLAQVCSKFTKTSTAISEQQLETIYKYHKEIETINEELYLILNKCLSDMFNGDKSQYAVYIFTDEFYINTSKFSLRTYRTKNRRISKDYLANSHECFAAEEFLVPSIRTQIKWAKYEIPSEYDFDKDILKSLLFNMLEENFRNIIAIKRMNEFGILSKVRFRGVFGNVTIIEEFMFDGRLIKINQVTYSKKNAANYLIERGYVLFGNEEDVYKYEGNLNRKGLVEHYMNYCVPVIQHMNEVIALYNLNRNDIIDFIISDTINPNKIKNHYVLVTDLHNNQNERDILKNLSNVNKQLNKKHSYWRAIE